MLKYVHDKRVINSSIAFRKLVFIALFYSSIKFFPSTYFDQAVLRPVEVPALNLLHIALNQHPRSALSTTNQENEAQRIAAVIRAF